MVRFVLALFYAQGEVSRKMNSMRKGVTAMVEVDDEERNVRSRFRLLVLFKMARKDITSMLRHGPNRLDMRLRRAL